MSRKNLIVIPNNLPPELQQTLLRMKNEIENISASTVSEKNTTPMALEKQVPVNALNIRNVKWVGDISGLVGGRPILANTYSTINLALSSISDNSITNQYVIFVFPGTYAEDFTAKDYVHIVGGGEDSVILQAQTSGGIVLKEMHLVNCVLSQSSSITDAVTTTIGASGSGSISSNTPTTNYHNNSENGFGTLYAGTLYGTNYIILEFDLSSLSGTTVTSAKLYMYETNVIDTKTYQVWGLLRNAIDTEVTYNKYTSSLSWSTPGAGGSGTDITAVSDSASFASPAGWKSITLTNLMGLLSGGTLYGFRVYGAATNGFQGFTPEGAANEPYLQLTYTGGGAPIAVGYAGKTTTLHNVTFRGIAGGLISTGFSLPSTGVLNINSCIFESTVRRGVVTAGTVYSVGNTYKTVLYDLINSGGTFYTAGDCYTTSSGTITPRGNADMLDGLHAANTSGAIPINNTTLNTDLNADMLDGHHSTYFTSRMMAVTTPPSYPYTVLLTDYVIEASASGGTVAVNLPAAAGNTGLWYHIHKMDATGTVNVVGGGDTWSITTLDDVISVYSNGSTWEVF